ncbi:MAG: NTP transferase domain-containing protein [candidate division Zixibacteria bacterium]|nr:NTP transferase domain-containing protein [candidate division Zixibacteria bacterium]
MRDPRDDSSHSSRTAVILAGGQGTRLRPYTVTLPKPLVPVGDRPIIEILLGQLVRDGFSRVIIAVGHMAGLIEAYCGDGSRWGLAIEYARETEPLGTAGPLATIANQLPDSFLVLNGDVLCDLDFSAFLSEHEQHPDSPILTVSTHRRILCSDYGVLETDSRGRVTAYHEKPTYDLDVSEGVYAFCRAAAEWIPPGEKIDFPDLVSTLLIHQQTIIAREHRGIWLDIGRPDDYERAQELIAENADRFPSPLVGAAATDRRPVGKVV